jgi:hypothetical protein
MRKNTIVLLMSLLIPTAVHAKVLIITHSYNRPEFIEIQYKTFKHFLQDEYEFVVFNDANTAEMFGQITAMCDRYHIRSIAIPQEIHDRPYLPRVAGDPYHRPNIRHANVLQYSLDVLGFDFDGIVAIVDSDLFLVKPMSISEFMVDCDIASVQRGAPGGIICMWPGIVFLRMDTLPDKRTLNFNCGPIGKYNVDSGGWTHYYLSQHPALRIKWVNELQGGRLFCPDRFHEVSSATTVAQEITTLRTMGFDDNQIQFLQNKPDTIGFVCNGYFLHYRAGSNYDNQSAEYMKRKQHMINAYLNLIVQQ